MKMKIFSCDQLKWVPLFTSKIGSKHSQPRGQCLAFPSLQPDVFWFWLLGSSCSCSPKKARSMAEARLSRLRGCCLNKPLQAGGPCQWHARRAVEWKYTHSGGFQQTGQPNAASSRGRINFASQRIRQDAPKVVALCCSLSRGHALTENYLILSVYEWKSQASQKNKGFPAVWDLCLL